MWVISEDHGIRLAACLLLLPCRVTWKGIESSNSGKFERVFQSRSDLFDSVDPLAVVSNGPSRGESSLELLNYDYRCI